MDIDGAVDVTDQENCSSPAESYTAKNNFEIVSFIKQLYGILQIEY